MARRFRPNGAKGFALLGFAVVAMAFGVAFLSPWALIPPPPLGLAYLDRLIPLQVWGGVWWASAVLLLVGAYREDQSKAMVLFAPMLFIFAASYGMTIGSTEGKMQVAFILQTAIFFGLFVACLAVSRLVNAPPVDIGALVNRVNNSGSQEGSGGEH